MCALSQEEDEQGESSMTEKTIEDMAHDYLVASLRAGKVIQREDIENYCKMAAQLKGVAKVVQRDVQEDERRRRW